MAAKKPSAAALKKFEQKFAKTYGDGSLIRTDKVADYEVISTGSLALDYVLSVGGLVEGRLTEYWGPDGVGKTTMALQAIKEAQAKHPDKMAAWVDMENKFDRKWAQAHGVDLSRLWLHPTDSAEEVADAMKDFVRSGLVSIVVLDSIGSMLPEVEKEKDADEATVGLQAKVVTRMVKLLASEAPKTSTAVIFINQVRANIGYGADTTTGGGFALKHSTTMKFKFKRTGTTPFKVTIDGEKRIVGHEIAVYVERNGVAPAYRTANIVMFHVPTEEYGPIGIDKADEATTLGITTGVIEQAGAWYTVPGAEKVNGRDAVVDLLRGRPDLLAEVRKQVLSTRAGEVKAEEEKEEAGDGPKFRKGSAEDA